jgi:glycolate oxidase iron-sulfur subunit
MLFEIFPYPQRLRAALLGVVAADRLGLRSLLRGTGILDLVSPRLEAMESILPTIGAQQIAPSRVPSVLRPRGTARRRVGLISGCVQRVLFDSVNAATARTLLAEGCEVVIPTEQGCCGALELHAGEEARTVERAKDLIAVFERADVDTIVINAAGCGSTLKEYGHLLRDDPRWSERAAAFSSRVRDISEILAELEPWAAYHPLAYRVAYHDACHLRHAQGVYAQPRAVLGRIPQLEILEIAESELCCGSAGIYNLVQPEAARELGDRKATNIAATQAQAVATSNPGCLLQIKTSLGRRGASLPVVHPIELLDASIRGVLPSALEGLG